MGTRIPDIGDAVRVHRDINDHGHHLNGMLLTVTDLDTHDPADVKLDATVYTGDRPVHIHLADVDVVTNHAGRWVA